MAKQPRRAVTPDGIPAPLRRAIDTLVTIAGEHMGSGAIVFAARDSDGSPYGAVRIFGHPVEAWGPVARAQRTWPRSLREPDGALASAIEGISQWTSSGAVVGSCGRGVRTHTWGNRADAEGVIDWAVENWSDCTGGG